MNGLLKLIYSAEQAKSALKLCKKKGLMLVDKKHGIVLDDEIIEAGAISVNLGGYGTSFSVNIGEKFGNSWGLTDYSKRKATIYSDSGSITQWDSFSVDYSDPRGKSLTNLNVFFTDKKSSAVSGEKLNWLTPIEDMGEQVIALGGTIAKTIDKADVVVTLSDRIELKVPDDVIVIGQESFIKVLPKPAAERAAPAKKIVGDANSLWKLLSVRDVSSINQGLELAASLPDQIDLLLEGCSVDKAGALVRSKRFNGSRPALAFLDLALLGLLAIAPEKSSAEKIRNSLKSLSITVAEVPKLVGFTSLEVLSLGFIAEAKLLKKDLSNFGGLPKLKTLKINSDSYISDILESLKGLEASNLETIEASSIGLKDISSLDKCTKLKLVDLSQNADLKKIDALASSVKTIKELSLSYCSKLQSIDALQGAINLRKLTMDGCESVKSIKPLSECTEFENLELDSGIQSLEGLENVIVENLAISYTFKPKVPMKLKDLISLKPPVADSKFAISSFLICKD